MTTEYTDLDRHHDQALALLHTWGSGNEVEKWEGHAFSVTAFVPDGMELESEYGTDIEPDMCTTVLFNRLAFPDKAEQSPSGWELVGSWNAGETECPACEASGYCDGYAGQTTGTTCPMCEGNKRIYWGEEYAVNVYAPIDTTPVPLVAQLETDASNEYEFEEHEQACAYEGEATVRIIANEGGESDPQRPLGWLNSARITTNPEDDSVTCSVSVGDPRGAFVFMVRRRPDTGELIIHMPHPGEGMPHMDTEQLHPGTLRVKS